MPPILMWVLVVVAAAVCGALGYYFGGENRKRTAEAKIGSAEEEAKRIVNDAIKAAEQKRKETIIEATGQRPARPYWISGLDGLEDLPKRFVVCPKDTQWVKDYVVQHCQD